MHKPFVVKDLKKLGGKLGINQKNLLRLRSYREFLTKKPMCHPLIHPMNQKNGLIYIVNGFLINLEPLGLYFRSFLERIV